MSRALVTGGGGFIGRHVVRELLDAGLDVTVMLGPGETEALLSGLDVASVRGDVRDLPSLDAAIAGHRYVVHLAAIYSLWMPDWRPLYDVNVQGTANVLRACADAGVERTVYTSSIVALGVPEGREPATEDTAFDQHGRCTHYALSKHYAERRVRTAQAAGQPVVTVYPAMPFGPGDHRPTPTGLFLLRALGGAYFAVSPGGINAVDVRDVARGHRLALESGEDGRSYLLSGHDLTMEEAFLKIQAAGGVSRPFLRTPGRLLQVLGRIGDLVGHVTEPLLDTASLETTSQHLTYDCSRAERELGYHRRPIEETFADAVAWFRDHGYPEPGMRLWDLASRRKMRAAAARTLRGE